MKKEDVLSKIQKCLSLAADPGATIGERDAANRMAEQLMTKYGIERLQATTKSEIEETGAESVNGEVFDVNSHWEGQLALALCKAFSSQVVYDKYHVNGAVMTFIGMKDDLEMVKYFWDHLQISIELLSDQHSKGKGKKYNLIDIPVI